VITATLIVPNRVEFVRPATVFLVQAARALHVPAAREPVFEVAISEAVTNAFKHGGGDAPSSITCQLELSDGSLTVRILDEGEGFEMAERAMPEISRDRIESIPASGYGLPIIHTVFPTLRVVNVQGRFALELVLPAEPVNR
jgi:anti-sigma regulatory factor (Ser/Thr protein kinase)